MFYVYTYRDPRPTKNLQVVYVGKGVGDRMYAHWRKQVLKNKGFGALLALLRRLGLEPVIEKVSEHLDEAEALAEEMRLIALYGRRDLKTGSLFNLTDGGEGLVGAVRTAEWVSNISQALSTPEQRASNSEAAKARWQDASYRDRVVLAIRQALADPEVQARREAAKAVSHRTSEFRATMSGVATELWRSEAYAAAVAAGQRAVQGTPEARQGKSRRSKEVWARMGDEIAGKIKAARGTAEARADAGAKSRAAWADPEKAARMRAANKKTANDPAVKAAKAAATKARWADPEWRAKMAAARAAKKLAAG